MIQIIYGIFIRWKNKTIFYQLFKFIQQNMNTILIHQFNLNEIFDVANKL